MSQQRPITPEDLYDLQIVNDARISPDGRRVAFCVQRIDRAKEKRYSDLWSATSDGDVARQLTFENCTDSHPRWSPDGEQLAFLSDRQEKNQSQIYVLPMDGGEARRLTDLKGEIETFDWSPDGKRLVIQFRRKDAEAIELENDEQRKELGLVARHITRTFYKLDGTGYLPKDRWHIWIAEVESGEIQQLTEGEVHDEISPVWSPDGHQIAFLSNRSPDPDLSPENVDLFVMPADGGPLRKVETPLGEKQLPSYSPDGHWLAYLGTEGRGNWWQNERLWIVPADGSGPARDLTGAHDVTVGNRTLGDVADRPTVRPVWSADSRRIYFQLSQHGNTKLASISLDGQDLQILVDEPGVIGTFSRDASDTRLACNFGDEADPGQIWLLEADSGNFGRLTEFNADLLEGLALGEREEHWIEGPAGDRLQGWIIKPPGFDPNRRYPAIVEIHGGPFLQYGTSFMHEFYYLAAGGYVVTYCNPRGSQGYGERHAMAIDNDWGAPAFADLMAWADYVEEQSYVDAKRMGVTGGSYGGYMTGWIIGHTDRFKAAVSQRMVSNLLSMWGSSDFNWHFQVAYNDRPPWEDLENLWGQSPMAHIGSATTPTLVIHSEQDLRCDVEQGLQLYVALKRLGVDTELVLFPEEFHGLSRGGRTDRRIVRLEHIKRWFDRYLQDGSANSAS